MINNSSKTFLIADDRGTMGVIEETSVPFPIRRIFWLSNVPDGEVRGQHAHKNCEQYIVCAQGSLTLEAESLQGVTYIKVMNKGDTFYLQVHTWLTLKNFSEDALVLVLASEPYDESEYIRSYDEFKNLNR